MISQKESSTRYDWLMTPIGNQEDYSFITTDISDASYERSEIKYMRDCIKELRDMVYELRDTIDSKAIIIDSCDEMYAEEWRET